MKTNYVRTILAVFSAALLISCSSSDNNQSAATTRGFAMGFTPWPYDATGAAVDFVYNEINARGDIIAHHLDSGIPWQEALDDTPYPAAVEAELNTRVAKTPIGQRVYLAISPFNNARDNLAGYWSVGANEALPTPWDTRDFDSPEVIQAYSNFAKNLINRFQPDYFNFGIEASELALNDLTRFGKFVTFADQVTQNLRADFPSLTLMISIGLKSPGSASATIINTELPQVVQYVDLVGVSIYPYIFFDHADKGDPANLPANWLSQIQTVANGKPIAVAETGWIAERLQIPIFGVDVLANEMDQDAYVKLLFNQAEALDAEFVVWFFLVDFDALWLGPLAQDPIAQIWRDTGLYDENVVARPALDTWMRWLAFPLK